MFYFALLTVLIWVYLVVAHGRFWVIEANDRHGASSVSGGTARVAVIIPARDEAAVIGEAVTSVARQVYSGPFHIFVVDDHSSDGTGDAACRATSADRLTVVAAGALPAGWAGKVWAMSEGVRRASEMFQPEFYLFTDADIVHAPDNLAGLLSRAAEGWDMVSLMVRLRCDSLAERALVPAFVYFFFKLYPPAWIASEGNRTAGAAGGCTLLRASALERAGGLAAIAGERIDDCALAARIKGSGGRVWLGAAARTRSVREYPHFGDILRMISRSAYTQLRYSPVLLAGTVVGMAVVYFAPVLLLFTRAWALGLAAWALMAMTFVPVLRLYDRSLAWAPLLPGMAGFYVLATVHSAWMHWRGRGGVWKGRVDSMG